MSDILGIGEALIEFVELDQGIYKQSFAGDVLNTLFYASRLGLHTEFFSMVGADSYSSELLSFLDSEGIGHSHIGHSFSRNNGLYIVRTTAAGEPAFTFFRGRSAAKETFLHTTTEHCSEIFSTAKVLLFSSIGLAVFEEPQKIVEAIIECPIKPLVYFDTNVRASLWKDMGELRTWLEQLASAIDILSVSKADDRLLYGERTSEESIAFFRKLGYKKIIVRDASQPIVYSWGNTIEQVMIEPITSIVDATGAGDAFNAGFLYGILNGLSEREAIQIGYRSAIAVLQERGGIVRSYSKTAVIHE